MERGQPAPLAPLPVDGRRSPKRPAGWQAAAAPPPSSAAASSIGRCQGEDRPQQPLRRTVLPDPRVEPSKSTGQSSTDLPSAEVPRKTRKRKAAASGNDCVPAEAGDFTAAGEMALSLMGAMLQSGAVPLMEVHEASDVARLVFVSRQLRFAGLASVTCTAVMVLDWAARSPTLSKAFVEEFKKNRLYRTNPEYVLERFRSMADSIEGRCWWKGPSRLNLKNFLETVDMATLLRWSAKLATGCRKPRATQLVLDAKAMPFLGQYLAVSMLRAVAGALFLRLRWRDGDIAHMSKHTGLLLKVASVQQVRSYLKAKFGKSINGSMLGYYLCQAVKLLRAEGVIKTVLGPSQNDHALVRALLSNEAEQFLHQLEDAGPDHWECPSDGSETEMVHNAFDTTEIPLHQSTDGVRRWRSLLANR